VPFLAQLYAQYSALATASACIIQRMASWNCRIASIWCGTAPTPCP